MTWVRLRMELFEGPVMIRVIWMLLGVICRVAIWFLETLFIVTVR